jgi:hypothetical protein
MPSLTSLALEVLESPTTSLGQKQVAATALLEAFDVGVETPQRAPMVVWRWLLAHGGSSIRFLRTHELPGVEVVRDAISVLKAHDVGDDGWELGAAVIPGRHADIVTEEDLAAIADRLSSDQRARRFGWMVERVHEERGLSIEFLTALTERLTGSENPVVREIGVEIGFVRGFDQAFAIRMLKDPSPIVRTVVADQLEKTEAPNRDLAMTIIRDHFGVERHRTVTSAMHHALGSLVRRSGRRIRMPEPPTGDEN